MYSCGRPLEVKKLAYAKFDDKENPCMAAFRYINKKFFPGSKWSEARKDPAKSPVALLEEILSHIRGLLQRN